MLVFISFITFGFHATYSRFHGICEFFYPLAHLNFMVIYSVTADEKELKLRLIFFTVPKINKSYKINFIYSKQN